MGKYEQMELRLRHSKILSWMMDFFDLDMSMDDVEFYQRANYRKSIMRCHSFYHTSKG